MSVSYSNQGIMAESTKSPEDMSSTRDMWTSWFNVDRPWTGSGDYETVERIQNYYGKICDKGYSLVAAQCRARGAESDVFDEHTVRRGDADILRTPCTTSGLVCRNKDQPDMKDMCEDYSIRFRCKHVGSEENNGGFFPQFDVRIYIILAVVPILIFLIRVLWAYVFRRRRQRRREERRARQRLSTGSAVEDDSSSIASGLGNPPPTYQELFGEPGHYGNRSSVFAITRGNIPICSKCRSIPCSVATIVGGSPDFSQRSNITTPTAGSPVANGGPGSVQQCPQETDVTSNLAQAPDTECNSTSNSQQPVQNNVPTDRSIVPSSEGTSPGAENPDTANVYTEIDLGNSDQAETVSIPVETSAEAQDPSANQQSTALPVQPSLSTLSVSLSSPSIRAVASSISQPCPCACHRTIPFTHRGVTGYENPGFSSDGENPNGHFPGMHSPVPGLQRVWSNLSSTSVITLSELPSYEDALELMKKKKEAESMQICN